jgi:hypothetical protein
VKYLVITITGGVLGNVVMKDNRDEGFVAMAQELEVPIARSMYLNQEMFESTVAEAAREFAEGDDVVTLIEIDDKGYKELA